MANRANRGDGPDAGSAPAAALFDVDGTLVDTVYLHTLAWWEAFRQHDRQVVGADIHHAIGMGSDKLLDALLGEDRNRDEDAELSAAHDTVYAQFWSRVAPLPGATDLLRACADRGWRVVLASSAKSREAQVMTEVLNADDVLYAVTTSDDVDASKPAPDLVRQALEKAGVSADRAVFVGDAVWDARAARRIGVRCLGVRTGGISAAELRDEGVESVYTTPADLLSRLDLSLLAAPPP